MSIVQLLCQKKGTPISGYPFPQCSELIEIATPKIVLYLLPGPFSVNLIQPPRIHRPVYLIPLYSFANFSKYDIASSSSLLGATNGAVCGSGVGVDAGGV